ncbi:uncharacterized protein N7529_001835 [Penicillium soppii]|uniref:uncharacterized protein n=1 Tax=Penicillium soppii TaxID=69789 RepID=UPI0025468434|nr:uncharacterized protein N7529_001835 [Penicillium soppii]KAJ5876251.1 hypothetical protein N7529_001835 [Penicillium soppii]
MGKIRTLHKDIDARGISASERAKQWGQSKLFDFVKSVEEEYIEFRKSLRKHALDENWKEFHEVLKYSEIHFAAESGSLPALSEFISHGADVKFQDKDGRTPLYLAAQSGSEDSITTLLKNCADAETQDKESRTPLQFAAQSSSQDSIRALVNHGTNVIIQDKDGRTPLHSAV